MRGAAKDNNLILECRRNNRRSNGEVELVLEVVDFRLGQVPHPSVRDIQALQLLLKVAGINPMRRA